MNYPYLLSIVIPTKNRSLFCAKVIEQIIEATSDETEIIIQDNNSDNYLVDFVHALRSDRVFLHHQEKTLSFVDNFSEALSFTHGKFVCMIGDDDGVLPNIEQVTRYADANHYDAVIPGLNSVYCWPSEAPIVAGAENGYLAIVHLSSKKEEVNPLAEQVKLLNKGFQEYQKTNIPRLYHGIVSKQVLEMIYTRTGSYFGGLTPDMYMSIALANTVQRALAIGFPITISGICSKSGSAASATGAHTGDLKDAPHFVGHTDYSWDKRVPAVYSVETIWADTGIHALCDFNVENLVDRNCLLNLYSRLWGKYKQFHPDIIATADRVGIKPIEIKHLSKTIKLLRLWNKGAERAFRKKGDVVKKYNVSDIYDAARETISEMQRHHIGDLV